MFTGATEKKSTGSVLILTLWALLFLGMLVVAVSSHVNAIMRAAEGMTVRTAALMAARSGAAAAVLTLVETAAENTNRWNDLSESWADNPERFESIRVGDGVFSIKGQAFADPDEVRFGLDDEQGRINLNGADKALLMSLFEFIGGADQRGAEELAESVLDWRDADDDPRPGGAETAYYQSMAPQYEPRNSRMQLIEELRLVKGMNAELYARCLPHITVWGSGKININTASQTVLECVARAVEAEQADAAASLAGKIRAYIEAGNRFESAGRSNITGVLKEFTVLGDDEERLLRRMVGPYLINSTHAFRGRVSGFAGGDMTGNEAVAGYTVEFVFDRSVHKMLYWREF